VCLDSFAHDLPSRVIHDANRLFRKTDDGDDAPDLQHCWIGIGLVRSKDRAEALCRQQGAGSNGGIAAMRADAQHNLKRQAQCLGPYLDWRGSANAEIMGWHSYRKLQLKRAGYGFAMLVLRSIVISTVLSGYVSFVIDKHGEMEPDSLVVDELVRLITGKVL